MCARSRSPKNALQSPTINKPQLLPVMMLATDRAAVPRPEGRSPMVATIEGFHCTSTMFSFLLVLVVLTQQVSSTQVEDFVECEPVDTACECNADATVCIF